MHTHRGEVAMTRSPAGKKRVFDRDVATGRLGPSSPALGSVSLMAAPAAQPPTSAPPPSPTADTPLPRIPPALFTCAQLQVRLTALCSVLMVVIGCSITGWLCWPCEVLLHRCVSAAPPAGSEHGKYLHLLTTLYRVFAAVVACGHPGQPQLHQD